MKISSRLAALAIASSAAPLAAGQASFELLGPYTNGSTGYIVRDVSADGRIVLGDVYLVGPFTWNESTGFTYLPTPVLADFPSAASGSALIVAPQEISPDARSMVGVTVFGDDRHQAFHWAAPTGYSVLPGPDLSPGFDRSFAVASNAAGTLIGGWASDPDRRQPVVWHPTVSTSAIVIPQLPGHLAGQVEDVADEAEVAVGTSFQSDHSLPRAFRWSATTGTVELPPPLGMHDATADCVSADGLVTFGFATTNAGDAPRLVRWDSLGRSEAFGGFPVGHDQISVVASNRDGTAAVGKSSSWIYDETSFYWSEATGVVDLRSLLESRGAQVMNSTAHFMLVRGMSADGNTIVGTMQTYGGAWVTTGFVARLAPNAPTPIGADFCAPGAVNSLGATPRLEAVGSSFIAHNDLVLQVRDLPGRSVGYLLASQTQGLLPGFGGGVGTQCLGSSFGLLSMSGPASPAGIFGRTAVRLDLPTLPLSSGTIAIRPGDTWNLQFWYRDSGTGGPTTNLTSARSITFE